MKQLNEKVAVITGAGSGLGRALAMQLALEGCHLALSDINETGLQETRELVRKSLADSTGKDHTPVRITTDIVDVAERTQVYQHADKVLREFQAVDLLINNAGVIAKNSVAAMGYEDFEWVININMWGVVYGTKAFLAHLQRRPEAHIVNIASINSMLGFPQNAPYTMSKYAILGFTETLIQEHIGTQLHISCVHPGGIKTNIANNARNLEKTWSEFFNRFAATSPEKAAKVIIAGIKRNQEKIFIGSDAFIMQLLKRLLPNASVHLSGHLFNRFMHSADK